MYSLFIACLRMFSMIAESKDIQSRINIKILFQFLHRLTSSRGCRPKWPFPQVIDLKVLYIDESDKRVYIFPPPYKFTNIFIVYDLLQWLLCLGKFNQTYRQWNSFSVSTKVTEQQKSQTQVTISSGNWSQSSLYRWEW